MRTLRVKLREPGPLRGTRRHLLAGLSALLASGAVLAPPSAKAFYSPGYGLANIYNVGALLTGATYADAAVATQLALANANRGTLWFSQQGANTIYKLSKQVLISGNFVRVVIDRGVTIDISDTYSDLANVTAGVVDGGINVIAGFKITGDGSILVNDGAIFSSHAGAGSPTVQIIGILPSGTDKTFVTGGGSMSGMYSAFMPGNGCTSVAMENQQISLCSHNIHLGWQEGAINGQSPQVYGWTLQNVDSSYAANGGDGLKIASFTFGGRVINGRYHHNDADGVDGFIGTEIATFVGVEFDSNTQHGAQFKNTDLLTGTGAGRGGYDRRFSMSACLMHDNGQEGLSIEYGYTDGTQPYVEGVHVDSCQFEGNGTLANQPGAVITMNNGSVTNCTFEANYGRGVVFQSCGMLFISGNQVIKNNIGPGASTTEGVVFSLRSGGGVPPKNTAIHFSSNTILGSNDNTGQQVGVDALDANVDGVSVFRDNDASLHNTINWNVSSAYTNSNVKFFDNTNLITRRVFNTGSLTSGAVVASGLTNPAGADYVEVTQIFGSAIAALKAVPNGAARTVTLTWTGGATDPAFTINIASGLGVPQ